MPRGENRFSANLQNKMLKTWRGRWGTASGGDGALPQYVNKYQMLTFVTCPGVNQVERTTACVHAASINSTEEYQSRISGRVTRLHGFYYDCGLNLHPLFVSFLTGKRGALNSVFAN